MTQDLGLLFRGQKSLSGLTWTHISENERLASAISQRYDLAPLIGQLLANRGFSLEDVDSFLHPTLKYMMPDPFLLKDMDKGTKRLIEAMDKGEKILVFTDYDVDGASASAILRRYLGDCGVATMSYVPDRMEEGYGPSAPTIKKLAEAGYQLIIMLDCGTTAFESLQMAEEQKIDVIIVDHHSSTALPPPHVALINPHRPDETSPLTHLCSAGLVLLFITALHRTLRNREWFAKKPEPDIRQYLDLAALGTVCDVMPLQGLNRAIVTQGLKVMAMRGNVGLSALADASGLQEFPTAYHLGFLLGPRINAGGRVGCAGIGSQLLATQDATEARELALKLNTYNQDRQIIENQILQQAMQQVEKMKSFDHAIIVVAGENWHPGVLGIVAGRLKETFKRPTCVIGFREDIGKGSGRSVPGIHLGQAMLSAVQKEILIYGGGHAMAAGFTVQKNMYPQFCDFLLEYARKVPRPSSDSLELDGILSPAGCTLELLDQLKTLEPFGHGNPTPRFAVSHVRCSFAEQVGTDHVRATFKGEDGSQLRAMAFRSIQKPLGQFLLQRPQHLLHIAGTLKCDTWQGRRNITLFLEDVMNAQL